MSLYSWSSSTVNLSKLKYQVELLNINTLYLQYKSTMDTSVSFNKIAQFCDIYGIDLYCVDGGNTIPSDGNIDDTIAKINTIYAYNQNHTNKIKGFNMDCEFYLSDEYKNAQTKEQKVAVFRRYVEKVKKECDYAKTKGLQYVISIPTWLETIDEALLEELAKYDFEHIAYMNYVKNDAVANIEKEVAFAKKYNKKIVSIAELQSIEHHEGLTEAETFYNDGLKACLTDLNKIQETYNYANLGISYHYYKPLVELVEREYSDINNYFDLDLYPYLNGGSTDIKKAKLVCGNQEIVGIPNYITESSEYILTFPKVEFNKTYKVILEETNYITEQEFTYSKEEGETYKKHGTIKLKQKLEQTYTLELYGHTENYASTVSLESGRLISGNDVIEGRKSMVDGVGILVFNNLKYDKEYSLELDDKSYVIIKGTYKKTDKTENYFGDDVILKVTE